MREAAGPDLVLDRVDGPTMLADLLAHPGRAAEHAATLVHVHRMLDGVGPRSLDVATTWVLLACFTPPELSSDGVLARAVVIRLADPATTPAEQVRLRQLLQPR